jgi:hypothetical protein
MLHLSIYVENLKKKNNERYRTIQLIQVFVLIFILSHDKCTELLPIFIF